VADKKKQPYWKKARPFGIKTRRKYGGSGTKEPWYIPKEKPDARGAAISAAQSFVTAKRRKSVGGTIKRK
jgi:hypothetical protein